MLLIRHGQEMGFDVEVHKLVDMRTKTRVADFFEGEKIILEKQLVLNSQVVTSQA